MVPLCVCVCVYEKASDRVCHHHINNDSKVDSVAIVVDLCGLSAPLASHKGRQAGKRAKTNNRQRLQSEGSS